MVSVDTLVLVSAALRGAVVVANRWQFVGLLAALVVFL
jgi:hypothetical protein